MADTIDWANKLSENMENKLIRILLQQTEYILDFIMLPQDQIVLLFTVPKPQTWELANCSLEVHQVPR